MLLKIQFLIINLMGKINEEGDKDEEKNIINRWKCKISILKLKERWL